MENVYQLNRCQLDGKNMIVSEQYIGLFSTPERVFSYLTHDGKSHGKLSVLGDSNTDKQHVIGSIGCPNATLVVHHDGEYDPLLGVCWPATNDYYYTRRREIID